MVDVPVASLTSAIIPIDIVDLKAEDRKAEMSFRKMYQVAAWAISAATAVYFFNQASLVWLHQMQARLPP